MYKCLTVLVLLLTACSSDVKNGSSEQCLVNYELKTFPINGKVKLPIDKVRTDRFGRMSVHVKKNLNINFLGSGWLSEGEYENINCKG